jgi:hypothetical protein
MMTPEQFEVLIRIDENVKALKDSRTDHEGRIRDLEVTKHKAYGMAALLGFCASYVKDFFHHG